MKVKIFYIVYHMQHKSLVDETVTILGDCSAQLRFEQKEKNAQNLFVTAQSQRMASPVSEDCKGLVYISFLVQGNSY